MRTLASHLSTRDNNLSAVRIIASFTVMFSHAWLATIPGIKTADYFHVFGFSAGHHGVHVFFILSGLLLTWSMLKKPDPLRSMIARVVRYFPAIIVSALVTTLIVGPLVTRLPLGEYFANGEPFKFLLTIITTYEVDAGLPGVFETNVYPHVIYVPLWTLHYELAFSFTLSILVATGLIRQKWLVLTGLIALLVIYLAWFWHGEIYVTLGSIHHLVRLGTAFGVGVALAVFADRVPVSNMILLGLVAVCAPLALTPLAAFAGMILLSYGILCLGFARNRLVDFLAVIGAWSYGLYVSSFLIEQTVTFMLPGLTGWQISLVSFALALAVGGLSWRFVEQPMLKLVNPITAFVRRFVPVPRPKPVIEPAPSKTTV